MAYQGGGVGESLSRRTVLRAAGATVVSGSLAGCLSQTIEKQATPVGMPPEKAKAAGYEPTPTVETISVEREKNLGPAKVSANVTSYIIQYEYVGTEDTQQTYGGYGEEDTVGLFTTAITPNVGVLGQNFNKIAESNINDLVRTRTALFEQFCSCTIGNTADINVRHVDDPSTAKLHPQTDVYLVSLPVPGCQNPNTVCILSTTANHPTSPKFLGTELTATALTAVFVPDFKNNTAYYAIGTKVNHQDDAVFASYVGKLHLDVDLEILEEDVTDLVTPTTTTPTTGTTTKATTTTTTTTTGTQDQLGAELIGPFGDGLFQPDHIKTFNTRLTSALTITVPIENTNTGTQD